MVNLNALGLLKELEYVTNDMPVFIRTYHLYENKITDWKRIKSPYTNDDVIKIFTSYKPKDIGLTVFQLRDKLKELNVKDEVLVVTKSEIEGSAYNINSFNYNREKPCLLLNQLQETLHNYDSLKGLGLL